MFNCQSAVPLQVTFCHTKRAQYWSSWDKTRIILDWLKARNRMNLRLEEVFLWHLWRWPDDRHGGDLVDLEGSWRFFGRWGIWDPSWRGSSRTDTEWQICKIESRLLTLVAAKLQSRLVQVNLCEPNLQHYRKRKSWNGVWALSRTTWPKLGYSEPRLRLEGPDLNLDLHWIIFFKLSRAFC